MSIFSNTGKAPGQRPSLSEMQARFATQNNKPLIDATPSPQATFEDIAQYAGIPQEAATGQVEVPRLSSFDVPPPARPEESAQVAYPNSPFANRTRLEPMEAGDTTEWTGGAQGQGVMRSITEDDWQLALEDQQGATRNLREGLELLQQDNTIDAAKAFLTEGQRTALTGVLSSSEANKFNVTDTVKNKLADRTASTLSVITNLGRNLLLADDEYTARNPANGVPLALEAMYEDGLDEPSMMALADLTSMATFKAITQTSALGRATAEEVAESKETGDLATDVKDYSNVVSSVDHFLNNAINRLGVKVNPKTRKALATAMFDGLISQGKVNMYHDKNGNIKVRVDNDFKEMSNELGLVSEAVAGDVFRRRSLTAPAVSGHAPKGKPHTTSRSHLDETMRTDSAEATKDIFGSVGYMFLKKDLDRETILQEEITSPEYMVDGPEGYYSTHWMADNKKVGRKAYLAAVNKVEKPADYLQAGGTTKEQHAANARAKAKAIMKQKIALMKYDLENVKASPGIRYGEWSHSTMNQRFFPKSSDLDYMSSKGVIRNIMSFAVRDEVRPLDFIESGRISNLKKIAANTLNNKKGVDRQKAMEALDASDLHALGTMFNIVVNYHTVINPRADILKETEFNIISMYEPHMLHALADLGKQYNAWLADPKGEGHDTIKQYMASVEPGEDLANVNLWDDAFRLETASKGNDRHLHVKMTHNSVNDGNQNGIFIQALMFGNSTALDRLGKFKQLHESAALKDMREYAFDRFLDTLHEYYKDDKEKQQAWAGFFNKVLESLGGENSKLAKDFFKGPLMQAAYGKDPSMFVEHVIEMLDAFPDEFAETLGDFYKSSADAGFVAALNLESTLREILDSKSTGILKGVGRISAILNNALRYTNIDGDTAVIGPVGMVPVKKDSSRTPTVVVRDNKGQPIRIKPTDYETIDVLSNATGAVNSYPEYKMQLDPTKSKGIQKYWSSMKNGFTDFKNFLGSSLSRQMAVMPVQAIDGGLVKLATIFTNRKRKVPVPASWVHDSIISTGSGALLYRNAYNNVAIPRSMSTISKFGKDIHRAISDVITRETKVLNNKEYVSIGDKGDYPALGAFFDEVFHKYYGGQYKESWMSRPKSTEERWKKKLDEANMLLKEASENGWVRPGRLDENLRANVAITPKEFLKLLDLVRSYYGVSDKELSQWAEDQEAKSTNAAQHLLKSANPSKGGINQMGVGGGNKPDLDKPLPKPIKKEATSKDKPKEEYAPIPQRYDERDIPFEALSETNPNKTHDYVKVQDEVPWFKNVPNKNKPNFDTESPF